MHHLMLMSCLLAIHFVAQFGCGTKDYYQDFIEMKHNYEQAQQQLEISQQELANEREAVLRIYSED